MVLIGDYMKILGVDPSINGTGFTIMELDDKFDILRLDMYAVCTTKNGV